MTHYQTLNVPSDAEHGKIVYGHEICLIAQTDYECVFGYVTVAGDVTDDADEPHGQEVENCYVPEPVFWLE